jgi:hypothetical protein
MNDSSKNCILFFVKNPVRGGVKRRLAEEVGDTVAVGLYKNFIVDMLRTLSTCTATRLLICVYPHSALGSLRKWLGMRYHYLPQEGKDLGERMKNSFIKAFSMEYERVILIGSDIPDLPRTVIAEAFKALETNEITVGPARDGGYYLIGFRDKTFVPEVFDNIRWGGKQVLKTTLHRVEKIGCSVHLLPAWSDVDMLADVMALLQRNRRGKCTCLKTILYLKKSAIGAASAR